MMDRKTFKPSEGASMMIVMPTMARLIVGMTGLALVTRKKEGQWQKILVSPISRAIIWVPYLPPFPLAPKRPALPPQDQRFRTVAVKPTRHRSPRRRTPSPPPLSATSDAKPPYVANSNSNKRDIPTSERPREGQGTRKREAERIKLPETSAAVVAAYSNRRRVISTQDEEPNILNSDAAGSRDGAASKLPPSGPGGRVQRAYGPALRDGPPRPKSPETLTGKEPPRGPRASVRFLRLFYWPSF